MNCCINLLIALRGLYCCKQHIVLSIKNTFKKSLFLLELTLGFFFFQPRVSLSPPHQRLSSTADCPQRVAVRALPSTAVWPSRRHWVCLSRQSPALSSSSLMIAIPVRSVR
ncbi:unnamed protein product [Citrullus colocynthis]|uniref:Uncharacterized protein n=1 Tax=Citrullus colocynthis TaxID=252529 RepID=A0ABP0Z4Z7_9ROSI